MRLDIAEPSGRCGQVWLAEAMLGGERGKEHPKHPESYFGADSDDASSHLPYPAPCNCSFKKQ